MAKVFQEHASKYLSICPTEEDEQGITEYWRRCMELTPENKPDFKTLTFEQCTLQYIVSTFAMQAVDILELDHLKESRHTRLIRSVAFIYHRVKYALEYEHELGLRSVELSSAPPSSVQLSGVDSLHEWVFRRIRVTKADVKKQYLVVDAVTSYRNGILFVLKDLTTNEVREIPEEDFEEMVASAEPLSDSDENSLEDLSPLYIV
ncbi:hypothetical protein EWM64_g9072 [Hericium alpestre]|uniref:Uncharacterized protein n=1 Tax=Hericium alpestre TaxID=135208 RepID=A0A4Y9ZM86_9AGAM|nr:hypothetical protein EWM64_g9072 [Hericium alpestre]